MLYGTMIRSVEKSFHKVVKRQKSTMKYDQKKTFYYTNGNVCLSFQRISHENTCTIPSCHHIWHYTSMYYVYQWKIGEINVRRCTKSVCIFTFVVVYIEKFGETVTRIHCFSKCQSHIVFKISVLTMCPFTRLTEEIIISGSWETFLYFSL